MNQTVRTFIAIPLPEMIIMQINHVRQRLKSYHLPIRWVRPENVHMTLKFLGNVSSDVIEGITETVEDSVRGCSPLTFFTKGLGIFPGIKKPRVLWMGISGDTKQLLDIQANLENQLEKKGFPKENRPFKSHLTLGRFKGHVHSEKLFDILQSFSEVTSEPFEAKELVIYKSELKSSGSVYTKLQTVFLESSQKI